MFSCHLVGPHQIGCECERPANCAVCVCSLYFWAVESFSTRICCKLITNWLTFKHFNMSRKQFFHFQIIKYHNHTVWLRCARVCVWVCECECSICIYSVSNFNNFIIVAVRKVSWVLCLWVFFSFFLLAYFILPYILYVVVAAVCLAIDWPIGRLCWLVVKMCWAARLSRIYAEKKESCSVLEEFITRYTHSKSRRFYGVDSNYGWVICWLRDTENVE